jgi:hypothetical protein
MGKRLFFLAPIILLFFCTCTKVEKDVNNYYPKVKTTDVTLMPDGSVKVTGEIVSEGNTSLVLIGFCMDTIADPGVLSNQQSVNELYGNTFTTTYTSLSRFHKYYFKAWAANENGYVTGNVIAIDSVSIGEDYIPCTLPMDTLTLTSSNGSNHQKYTEIGVITENTLEWSIDMQTDLHSLSISFGRYPIEGIYQTTANSTPEQGYSATITMDGYQAAAKASVYVRQIDSKTIEVTICNANIFDGLINNDLSTKFRASF